MIARAGTRASAPRMGGVDLILRGAGYRNAGRGPELAANASPLIDRSLSAQKSPAAQRRVLRRFIL
jgi:hypothetical protein